MLNKIIGIIILSCIVLFGCKTKPEAINQYSDPSFQIIAQHRDARNGADIVRYLKAKKPIHREAAARAFASIKDTSYLKYLYLTLMTDQEGSVRKVAAYAIGQQYDSICAPKLLDALKLEIDPSIQKVILEAIGKCTNATSIKLLEDFDEKNKVLQEGHTLGMFRAISSRKYSEKFVSNCMKYLQDEEATEETKLYAAFVLSRSPKVMTTGLCEQLASIKSTNPDFQIAINRVCDEQLPNNKVPFDASLLNSLKDSPYQLANSFSGMNLTSNEALSYLQQLVKTSSYLVVRTNAADQFFNNLRMPSPDPQGVNAFIHYCLTSGDMGLQSLSANRILNEADTALFMQHLSTLKLVNNKLNMPSQMETKIDLEKAIAFLEGKPFNKPVWPYNHPINWEVVKKIPVDQKVKIRTNKGEIIMRLYVEEAPGSVWNFLNSVDSGDYDGRFFHRVIPNFVAQGGCPSGDGWGSPNWTQRSEFSDKLQFKRGAVGLASVGNDTEGVQFFITHCATPHLDGRYTVFGQVTEGMDVVDKIVVGDTIIDIRKIETSQNP